MLPPSNMSFLLPPPILNNMLEGYVVRMPLCRVNRFVNVVAACLETACIILALSLCSLYFPILA